MVVAVRSGVVVDDYGEHRVIAGISRIVPQHDWLGSPEIAMLFGREAQPGRQRSVATARGFRVRSAATTAHHAPTHQAPRDERVILRQHSLPAATVEFTTDARRLLAREMDKADDREIGGPLLGYIDGGKITVVDVDGVPDSRKHERTRAKVPMDHERWEGLEAQWDGRAFVVGDWHTHPSSDGEPSEHDMRAWDAHRSLKSPRWAGLIFTHDDDGWYFPLRCSGWIVSRAGGRSVCEPANVVIPPE